MKDEDVPAAVEALKAWFISQDIKPSEATGLLVKIIAEQMVSSTDDLQELSTGIALYHNQLTMAVAVEREAKTTGKLQ